MKDVITDNYKLLHGDCLERMKEIPDGSVDLILTDPPFGTTACKWDNVIPFDEMWLRLNKLIKPNGAIVLFGSEPFSSLLRCSNLKMFRYDWVWEKEQGVNFLLAKKQPLKKHELISVFYNDEAQIIGKSDIFKSLREYFLSERERLNLTAKQISSALGNQMGKHYFTHGEQWTLPTLTNYKKLQLLGGFYKDWHELKKEYDSIIESKACQLRYNPQKTNGKPYISGKGESGKVTNSVKKVQTVNNGERYPVSVQKFKRETGLHPTQKPVALLEYLIKTYTQEGETVLDFTFGSCSTGVACLNTNRKFIGIELDNDYFDIGAERMRNR